MAWGFGSFEQLLYNLRPYNVTREELHRYLHQATYLSSTWGLEDLHVCLSDLARYVRGCLDRFNSAKRLPWALTLYTPPQIFYGRAVGLSDEELQQGLARVYRERFQLTAAEITLAQGHFGSQVPVRADQLASPRKSFEFSPRKTVQDFLDYEHPNGHYGVYPLDSGYNGVFRSDNGFYKIDPQYLNLPKD